MKWIKADDRRIVCLICENKHSQTNRVLFKMNK